jgi:thioredoxin-related protein
MVEWILQGKDDTEKKERFEQIMLHDAKEYQTLIKDVKKPFVYSAEVEQVMSKMDKAVMELNVRGTPSLFDASFEPVSPEILFQSLVKGSVKK